MMRTTRLRRMTLQLRQSFLTEARTFIIFLLKTNVPAHLDADPAVPALPKPKLFYFARKTMRPLVKSYGVS